MRKTLVLGALAVAGCTATTEVPSGLPATLAVTWSDAAGDTSIVASGDEVVATATLAASCVGTETARAGLAAGRIVVTVTDSLAAPFPCALIYRYVTYRVTVGPVRPGTYPVTLQLRNVIADQRSTTPLGEGLVVLP